MAQEAMDCDLQEPLDGTTEQAAPTEVTSQGAPLLQPAPAEVVSSQGGALGQHVPAEVVSSQSGLPLLQPVPPASIDLTEDAQLSEGNVEAVNPGTSEEHRQGSSANQSVRAATAASMNNFISGLQRLHNMLELLRPPPSNHSVGPVRMRRRTGSILRARTGGSQRPDGARLRTPVYAYFQVSRSQPYVPATAPESQTGNPTSGTDSDSDSSAENEEVVVQAEEPEANIPVEHGVISAEQEATSVTGGETVPEELFRSLPRNPTFYLLWMMKKGKLAQYVWNSGPVLGTIGSQPYAVGTSLDIDAFLNGLKDKHENVLSDLLNEQMLRKQAELESAQCRLQLQVLIDKCTKLNSRVQNQHKYSFQKTFAVSQTGNCRIMAYCDVLSCLVVSQPSPQTSFLPGFGVKMLSTANMKSSQYIPMHSKQIRGLAFSSRSKGLLLSASFDNTIKLTSLETNTVVQTYNTGRPVWSCCWCLDENNYIYAGLANGSILIYDLRNTNAYIQELVPQKARCPLVSLSYLPRAAVAAFPYGGLLAGTLENASFWELKTDFSHKPHVLSLEPGGFVDFQTESSTRHCLVTYRPDKSHNTIRTVLLEMSYKLDDAGEPVCSCLPVQTFLGGPTCKLLTKNAIFQSPENDGNVLVCTGDEASKSVLLWNAGSGSLLQDLKTDQPVLDICPFEANQSNYLATLTEKDVHFYKWE
ncbi:hypothetical protein U0070_014915 [Myodes glareolus]|uniref:RING-type E3 ubiquitin transferase n=1 Tax=Myodes glareolus TaxID=447135 RepID=A0AAW0HHT8_MYOGA